MLYLFCLRDEHLRITSLGIKCCCCCCCWLESTLLSKKKLSLLSSWFRPWTRLFRWFCISVARSKDCSKSLFLSRLVPVQLFLWLHEFLDRLLYLTDYLTVKDACRLKAQDHSESNVLYCSDLQIVPFLCWSFSFWYW